MKACQDVYPEHVAQCDGCGTRNGHGHHLKTFRTGEESAPCYIPEPFPTAMPAYMYGGLIVSLAGCRSTGVGSTAMYRAEGREMDTLPPFRFVTGSLQEKYRKPTQLGIMLKIRSRDLF
ncbi:MAG TPA: PaaI family thioesterase [Burkholderiaceae bacterium]|nr:PaaI family thioesterase [Burkholderiaceae bacterium]